MAFTPRNNNNNRSNNGLLTMETAKAVQHYLTKNQASIMQTLPQGFNYQRMCRTAVNAISTTPSLAKCSAGSLFLSIVRAFSLGLEPNGALGEGYLVPFYDKNSGGTSAQFMPSYRGLMNLARRSKEVSLIYAAEVYGNDKFSIRLGLDKTIIHEPDVLAPRGNIVGYYAVVKYRSGDYDFEFMTVDEIEKIRSSSKSKDSGPWQTWYEEMAKKTVIKRLLKRCPLSVEMADAIKFDNGATTGEPCDDVLDIDGVEVPPDQPPAQSKFETSNNAPLPQNTPANQPNGDDWLPSAIGSGCPVTADQIRAFALQQGISDDQLRNNLGDIINDILNGGN